MDLAKNIGMPDSLLSRFDLVFVVRDLSDEFIDKKIATQVLTQARGKLNEDGRRRGVEQIHSSILERRAQADVQKSQEATEVFQKRGDEIEGAKEVLTVDFLRKYIKYCKRFTPVLSEEAQTVVAEKYVDMRRRFQSGFTDVRDPQSEQKPRLAVTTRTLEALIRLATAHAKMKLRKDEVLAEDVLEAYKLMLSAREEEPTVAPEDADEPDDDTGGDEDGAGPKGTKRKRASGAAGGASPPSKRSAVGGITSARTKVLETLVARTFARMQLIQEGGIAREELLENVNAELAAGEEPFGEEEFDIGIASLEAANKLLVTEGGDVMVI
jgi:DNA replication licensing factor MCM3